MENLTEHIPASLRVYLEQFESEPEEAISRLEQHVNRRGVGAVGHYLLAWLYFQNSDKASASRHAWTAKILAPGSPHLELFHYYITHPDGFKAWKPETVKQRYKKDFHKNDKPHPIHDLDNLINKLSAVEKERIRLSEEKSSESEEINLGEEAERVDDIVTETLALIHEQQKNYTAAINTYKQLRKTAPAKKEYFDEQIFRLKQIEAEMKSDKGN